MNIRRFLVLSGLSFLLFAICFGLGYPTLNRYNPPSIPGMTDTVQYSNLVGNGPQAAVAHWNYRVLVPFLAKPVYWAVRGRLGTWDSISFALLVVNSAFCAAAAFIVIILAKMLSANSAAAILAGFAYLLNFTVANYHLSGLVDSGEAFCVVLLIWAMMAHRWTLLPVIGLLAGLTKDTFIPIGFVFAATWVFLESNVERAKPILSIAAMSVVGVSTAMVVRSAIDRHLVTPWHMVAQENLISHGLVHNLVHVFGSWNLWLTIIWLPFVFLAGRRIPRGWRFGAFGAAGMIFVLSVWNDAASNAARPVFDFLGSLLAISFALSVGVLEKFVEFRSCNSVNAEVELGFHRAQPLLLDAGHNV
jgi:hypothetical protein